MVDITDLKHADDVAEKLPNLYRKTVGRLPEQMQFSFAHWVFFGVNIGGNFMNAIISNDLVEAYGRADLGNQAAMQIYATWLYNDAPRGSWGDKDTLSKWAEAGGVLGVAKSNGREEIEDSP